MTQVNQPIQNTKNDMPADGWIDRFLIIHTAEVQEDNGGSGSIWSHYGPLSAMVEVDGYKFDHYTIAGFDSGFGTIIHEMLHQMGALDLYDVHGQGTGEDWNGLGDWDVMASGNWNGVNGRTPALPSLATLDLIGVDRATEISVNNPGETQNYVLSPLSSAGSGLFIQISPSERVWMAFRGSNGFDSDLPGHGLLVTVQDTSVGDKEQNLINTNPDIPWFGSAVATERRGRSPKDAPWMATGRPRRPQEDPRRPQEAPRRAPQAPTSVTPTDTNFHNAKQPLA